MHTNNTSAAASIDETLLTPAEAAKYLKISLSGSPRPARAARARRS
jgi:hypothetical protein